MTEVIPTRGSHLPHESFMPMLQTVFGSCGVDFSRPWQTKVCPTGGSHPHTSHHAESDAVAGLGLCGADFSLPCLG